MTFMEKHVFGLIPARGGSKGLPNKNMIDVNGFPMLDYTISAAKESEFIDTVVVSSDDEKIINYALSKNTQALRRPKEFSTDESTAHEVVNHFSEIVTIKHNIDEVIICYLQPTSPLRKSKHIDEAFKILLKNEKDMLISVSETINIPYKMFNIDENGFLAPIFEEGMSNMRRQDLPKTYIANGAIYVFPLKVFKRTNKIPSNNSIPFFMSKEDSVDVDSIDDLKLVKSLMSKDKE